MKAVELARDTYERLVDTKRDASWQRYEAGWPDICDRYNVTAALVRGPAVLDIGCGQGLLAWLLRERGLQFVGIDAQAGVIEEARARMGAGSFHVGYAEDIPFLADASFDTVVLGQVLEHVWSVEDVAREALRVLKPQGRLIVNVPRSEAQPHGNHLRVFASLDEMLAPFGMLVEWSGKGQLHQFYYAWGDKR